VGGGLADGEPDGGFVEGFGAKVMEGVGEAMCGEGGF
jgi:hypothetical protein